MKTKICTKCKVNKNLTLEYFPPHNKTKSGFDSWCRLCRSAYRNETRRGKYRNLITDEQLKYNLSTIKSCELCGRDDQLVVDHDHIKNKYRGLLCNHCNRGLGHFRDDPEILFKAIQYLQKSTP